MTMDTIETKKIDEIMFHLQNAQRSIKAKGPVKNAVAKSELLEATNLCVTLSQNIGKN